MMPVHVAGLADRESGGLDGKTVLILGAAYRGGVKETAFSGVFPLRDALEERGARVEVHDPLYSPDELEALGLRPWDNFETPEVAILQADHLEYREWSYAWSPASQLVVDGRRILNPRQWPSVRVVAVGVG